MSEPSQVEEYWLRANFLRATARPVSLSLPLIRRLGAETLPMEWEAKLGSSLRPRASGLRISAKDRSRLIARER
jgi:hypothetical protein